MKKNLDSKPAQILNGQKELVCIMCSLKPQKYLVDHDFFFYIFIMQFFFWIDTFS